MASKKKSMSRQESANRRAQDWGFKNDYQFRKWTKAKGITGVRGPARISKILDNLDNPSQFRAARKSGNLAKGLSSKGATYYDPATKTRRPLTKQRLERYIGELRKRDMEKSKYWRMPKGGLRTVQDYEKLILVASSDYEIVGHKVARVQALFFTMVMHNGLSISQFIAKYRDAIVAAGLDPKDFDEFAMQMIEDFS